MGRPSRADLVERLALVSHASWVRQKARDGGIPQDQVSLAVTDHDRERAEDVVRELEATGIYPARRPSQLLAALHHPLVVGAALALLSGVLASLLIPALTRVWQDRQKELALKRGLVQRIAKATTSSVYAGRYAYTPGKVNPIVDSRVLRRIGIPWLEASSVLTAELTTYFHGSGALKAWNDYVDTVTRYLQASAFHQRSVGLAEMRTYFDGVRFDPGSQTETMRRGFVTRTSPTHEYARSQFVNTVPILLLAERDQLSRRIVDTPASGFSHGWWIFR